MGHIQLNLSETLQLIEIRKLLVAAGLCMHFRYWLFVISYLNNK